MQMTCCRGATYHHFPRRSSFHRHSPVAALASYRREHACHSAESPSSSRAVGLWGSGWGSRVQAQYILVSEPCGAAARAAAGLQQCSQVTHVQPVQQCSQACTPRADTSA
jgi:hypothetical protein